MMAVAEMAKAAGTMEPKAAAKKGARKGAKKGAGRKKPAAAKGGGDADGGGSEREKIARGDIPDEGGKKSGQRKPRRRR